MHHGVFGFDGHDFRAMSYGFAAIVRKDSSYTEDEDCAAGHYGFTSVLLGSMLKAFAAR